MNFYLLQYELVGELFSEKVAGPAPTKRQRGVVVRAAKEQPKGGAALKSHKQTVGSQVRNSGFPLTLENLENWEKFFQSGKSQGILKFYQKVREF